MTSRHAAPIPVACWVVLSIVPLFHVWTSLTTNFLADNPLAYLVWIPVFAFGWAIIRILSTPAYPNDRELNSILGVAGMILFGLALAIGGYRWPWAFSVYNLGILLWPLWSLALAWLLFGVGITKRLIWPLVYLILAWPPFYTKVVALTMPVLNSLDISSMALVDRLHWVKATGTAGTYAVQSGHFWVPVQISQVCSGADSFIAVLLFLPLVLAFFEGSRRGKAALLGSVAAITIILNFLRLQIILWLLHLTGPSLALNIVHPILGFFLLAGLFLIVWVMSPKFGLTAAFPELKPHLPPPHAAPLAVAGAAAVGLLAALAPLGQWGPGTPNHPVTVATTRLPRYLPALAGFHRSIVLRQSESSIMGPGSATLAVDYRTASQDIMAEVWRTQDPLVLAGLGGRNCLLFHGDRVLRSTPVSLWNHVQGTAFVVAVPTVALSHLGPEYVDIEYTAATHLKNGHRWYFRVEVASWVSPHVLTRRKAITAGDMLLRQLLHGKRPLATVLRSTADRLNLREDRNA